MAEKIEEVIERVLENDIRPALKAHGGDVRVISFEKRRLNIRLLGQCSGCPSARLTAEELIGERIREKVPEVEAVILVQEISQDLLDFAKNC
ncbi:NifU family protein [Clostridium sp. AM58-1XD]|uniref:NifU family protein n=1 Tax=Clostridium sp. AM58-1XD TaxID=2292307 RepID=UPI000E47D0CB|nr:NifU family protein [Clostridium sp. AM58-1XD]RGY99930.1 NifU family protein [Clostridium sp. AM58-1XD]